jgi:hypothetical protein
MNNMTRRNALKLSATGMAFAAGNYALAQAPVGPPSTPAPAAGNTNGWFDVTAFGARGDGATPADPAIRRALKAAYDAGGGVVWLPAGKYLLDSKLIVERPVTLMGAGWASSDTSQGTWLCVKKPGVNLEIRGRGTVVQGIAFLQEQPAPDSQDWKPANHDFAIHAGVDDVFLKQINLFGCTKGICIRYFSGGCIGRVILDHIWGRPLQCGIEIDGACDVVKVNNVHFWPFWAEGNPFVEKWTQANGTGISVFKCDNPQFSNIFVLSYNRGFAFGASSAGVTSKFAITNADCDYCENGLEISGAGTTGSIVNFNTQGGPGNTGIFIKSSGSQLFGSNVRLTNFRANGIRAEGRNTRVFMQNLWLQGWNMSKAGFPGVEACDGATVYLGRPLAFDGGFGGPKWRRDGINGGRVLTEYNELVAETK